VVCRILPLLLFSGLTLSCVTYGYYDTNRYPSLYSERSVAWNDNRETRQSNRFIPELSEADVARPNQPLEVVGHIRIEKLFIHPFFFAFPNRQREALRKAALKQAEARYGSNIALLAVREWVPENDKAQWQYCCVEMGLANLRYESKWHVFSLLLAGGIGGWVEKGSIEAVVVRETATQEILPSYLLYYLASPCCFNWNFWQCCYQ
jgi:hypothetical protein